MKLRNPQRFPGPTNPLSGRGHHRSLSRCFRPKSIPTTTPSRDLRLEVTDQSSSPFLQGFPNDSCTRGSIRKPLPLSESVSPNGQSTKHLTQHDCNRIAMLLKTRPRKRLGYPTPEECYAR
jgi:hypothetical protein